MPALVLLKGLLPSVDSLGASAEERGFSLHVANFVALIIYLQCVKTVLWIERKPKQVSPLAGYVEPNDRKDVILRR